MDMKRKQKLNYFNTCHQKLSLSLISCLYSCPERKLAHLKWLGALVFLLITFFEIGWLMWKVTFCWRFTCILAVFIFLDMENTQKIKD